jgi:hypothetical protein
VISLLHRALLWAQRLGKPCKTVHTRKLGTQCVCSQHFSETDFILADETHLINVAVLNLCTVIVHPFSAQHSGEHLLQFIVIRRKPSRPDPRKNILQNVPNLGDWWTCSVQSHTSLPSVISPDMTSSRKQHFFKGGHLFTPWLCKWKCLWWRNRKHQPSEFLPRA